MPVISMIGSVWIAATCVAALTFAASGVIYIRTVNAFHALLQRDYPDQFRNLRFGMTTAQLVFYRNSAAQIDLLIDGLCRIDTPDPHYRQLLIRARISILISLAALVVSFVALGFTFQTLGMR